MALTLRLRKYGSLTYSRLKHIIRQVHQASPLKKEVKWESVIGLEVHAQISANSKLFSGSATLFAAPVNNQVAFFDAALPGTLPVLNKRCVEAGVLTALAMGCHINMVSKFDRKHYFYADLPAGYQITQQRQPLAVGGKVRYMCPERENSQQYVMHEARLTQLQLEQDSGKSLHDTSAQISLIDLNRAGIGLMEIVTEPDFRNAHQAASFVRELQLILQTLGTCDGKMAEGSLRVDASISLHRPGEPLGVRAEVKNINSVRNVAKAIDYEIVRQTEILENGGEVINETRAFDFETETTISMRDKEKVHDYRFLPEPNLPPLVLCSSKDTVSTDVGSPVNVEEVKTWMPELPEQTRQRLQSQYGLTQQQSVILTNDPILRRFFEEMIKDGNKSSIKPAINLLLNELLGLLNKKNINLEDSPVTPDMLAEVANMVSSAVISLATTKKLLERLLTDARRPQVVVEENNWNLITDGTVLDDACSRVIKNNVTAVESYVRGKEKVFNFLMGQLQKETRGRAEPKMSSKLLREKLNRLKQKGN